jgi:hypothetical protein
VPAFRRFVERLDQRASEKPRKRLGLPPPAPESDRRRSDLRRNWGSQQFAERLHRLGQGMLSAARHRHARRNPEHRAHGETEARRLLEEGLARLGWTPADLKESHGSERNKVALAAEIWHTTTVSQAWIAQHLCMRSAENVSQQIRRHRLQRAQR